MEECRVKRARGARGGAPAHVAGGGDVLGVLVQQVAAAVHRGGGAEEQPEGLGARLLDRAQLALRLAVVHEVMVAVDERQLRLKRRLGVQGQPAAQRVLAREVAVLGRGEGHRPRVAHHGVELRESKGINRTLETS